MFKSAHKITTKKKKNAKAVNKSLTLKRQSNRDDFSGKVGMWRHEQEYSFQPGWGGFSAVWVQTLEREGFREAIRGDWREIDRFMCTYEIHEADEVIWESE